MIQNSRLSKADFGEWLQRYSWSWWLTCTFDTARPLEFRRKDGSVYHRTRGNLSPIGAVKIFEKFLSLKLGENASYFVAAESRQFLHLHALVGNVNGFNRFIFMKAWEERYGFARCFPYDGKLGAAYYLVKDIESDKFEWDIRIPKKEVLNDDA